MQVSLGWAWLVRCAWRTGEPPGLVWSCLVPSRASALPPGSGNVLKVQQLLHICSEHFDSKEKEEEKEKKEKKDKEKKESPADMGAHQVPCGIFRAQWQVREAGLY